MSWKASARHGVREAPAGLALVQELINTRPTMSYGADLLVMSTAWGTLPGHGEGADNAWVQQYDALERVRAIENGKPAAGVRGLTLPLSDARDHRWVANVLPLVDGSRKRTGEMHDAIAAVQSCAFRSRTQCSALPRHAIAQTTTMKTTDAMSSFASSSPKMMLWVGVPPAPPHSVGQVMQA